MLDTAPSSAPRAIVIGSGFGGLAAAVRLGARGYQVLVLEQMNAPGGRAYVYKKDGFTFDGGPTIITAPYLLHELWELAGRRLEDDLDIRPIDPFYQIRYDDGEILNYSGSIDRTREEVRRIAPEDVEGFDRYLQKSGEIYQVAYEELADQPFHKVSTLLRTFPDLIRLGGFNTVYRMVCRYFKSPKMRVAMSFHPLLVGGNPLTTTSYYCLISHLERTYGVHYAMGGTGAVVKGLEGLIERQGGEIRYNTPVTQITVDRGRANGVRLASGEHLPASLVVSNADSATTYTQLLSEHPRRHWTDRRIERTRFSMSLFVWYFGTNTRYEDVYHHMILMGPRYEELLKDIFQRKILAEDFSLYLHRPTASDPDLAPPGCDTFYVLSPVPHLQSGVDWTVQAEPYRAAIQKYLEDTVLPGLGESIVTSFMLTPLDFRDRLSSVNGAAFSLEPQLFQSAWFRPHNVSEEVERLYLVGAGTHPGAGLPGVINSARLIDRVIPEPTQLV